MKKNYTFKLFITLFFVSVFFFKTTAQIRIIEVNPVTETVKLRNFGSSTVDISNYRLCSRIVYRTLSTQTTVQSGLLMLASNSEVEVTVNGAYMNDTAADLGLYLPTGSFAVAANMVDFMQYGGSFPTGSGRESVAVEKGIWTAGTFVNIAAPYEYTGNGSQNGSQFWSTLLGVDDFNIGQFKILQNPSKSKLELSLPMISSTLTLDVFDILGKKILTKQLNEILTSIDVSKWNSGVYLVRLSADNITQTKRFVKQ